MKMKVITALLLLSGFWSSCFGIQRDTLPVKDSGSFLLMFWNLENFFDWRDDSLSASSSDAEFSSFGKRHWTRKKFYAKCNAVAKSILWIQDQKGRLPDLIGVAEIENRFVLSRLLDATALRKAGYSIIHFESPDIRGIDVALLYRASRLKLLRARPLRVMNMNPHGPPLLTRDIFLAEFQTSGADSLAVLVNHHPSKYGDDSQWRREVALHRLRGAADSLQIQGFKNIIAMGDFNDTPRNKAFEILTGDSGLMNISASLAASGEGTIRYEGKWELIDMFFISQSLFSDRQPVMEIERIPFLMVKDNAHSGEKPFRTYSGPRYIGGVSDHCPILLDIR